VPTSYTYAGPSVHGYETDRPLRRAAEISVHTSPLAALGSRDAGGMNVYVRDLSCHLARLGLPIDVFTRRTDPDTPEVTTLCEGVNVVAVTAGPPEPLPKNNLYQYLPEFAAGVALYAARQGLRYDVVHSHYWLSGRVARLLQRYWETPFVHMYHTMAHRKNAVAVGPERETALRLQVERALVDQATGLIAANPDERADLVWRLDAHPDRVCTIPPGVDLELFAPRDRAACRARLGLDRDEVVVLFVGRIDPVKGLDTLLCAARCLHDAAAPVTLVVVGGDLDERGAPTGALRQVAALAHDVGVAPRVRLVGAQPQDQLPDFYGAADAVAVPSRYESFGLVAVEAMACGVPVVASRAGGLAFTVDERAGILVPPNDPAALAAALRRVVTDPALRAQLGAGARECAERFAWPAIAAEVLHLYARLAAGSRVHLCRQEVFA